MLRVEEHANSIVATIDRPDAENRLNAELLTKLQEVLTELSASSVPQKVFVLNAAGPDFSLGRQRSADPQTVSEVREEFEHIQATNDLLYNLPLVTVSALHGRAEGAGLSLAGRCDIVVAADEARLSFPEIPHGIPPTIVLSHYRYVLPPHVIGDLIFSGRELSGPEAVQFGLAARSVPHSELEAAVQSLAAQIGRYDRESMRLVKQFLRDTEKLPPHEAPKLGIAEYVLHTFRGDS